MPRRELKHPHQVEQWLVDLGGKLTRPGKLILIGSGGLLWHAAQRGIVEPLPENSMDVDPITDSEEIAALCYDAMIGSEFEKEHGWHVNLMPERVLRELPPSWEIRASTKNYGVLAAVIPAPDDLLVPKRKRNEPRDRMHDIWASRLGLLFLLQMKTRMEIESEAAVWGDYPNYDDIARFEYGRQLWRRPEMRARLLAHWLDPRHPYSHRFAESRSMIEAVLESGKTVPALDAELQTQGSSLRCLCREIPPVFGSFFPAAQESRSGSVTSNRD